jgi:hypothetical protein
VDRVCLYPFGGGVGGDISVSGRIALDLQWRKLDRLERALYSGSVVMSFSFCWRRFSRS